MVECLSLGFAGYDCLNALRRKMSNTLELNRLSESEGLKRLVAESLIKAFRRSGMEEGIDPKVVSKGLEGLSLQEAIAIEGIIRSSALRKVTKDEKENLSTLLTMKAVYTEFLAIEGLPADRRAGYENKLKNIDSKLAQQPKNLSS